MNILLATNASLDRGGISLFMLQWIRGIRKVDNNGIIAAYFRESIEDEDIETMEELVKKEGVDKIERKPKQNNRRNYNRRDNRREEVAEDTTEATETAEEAKEEVKEDKE